MVMQRIATNLHSCWVIRGQGSRKTAMSIFENLADDRSWNGRRRNNRYSIIGRTNQIGADQVDRFDSHVTSPIRFLPRQKNSCLVQAP